MLVLKKTALVVMALGSTAVFAGTMGPVCSAVNVTAPCETCAWDFGGRALYLRPTGLGTGGTAPFDYTSYANGQTYYFDGGTNAKWGWGFQLEASYHYNTGNDLNVNWYHFKNSTNYTAAPTTFWDPVATSDRSYKVINSESGNLGVVWDQVNIEFGQHTDFGQNKWARFHAGMNYSHAALKGTFNRAYGYAANSTSSLTQHNSTRTYNNSFNGFGPRVGMDLAYEWGNGFGIYGNGAVSVLVGSSKSGFIRDERIGLNENYHISSSQDAVVPEVDAKLGAMYTYACAQGDLSLDVGWLFAAYAGAINVGSAFDSTNADHPLISTKNFGVQGLYFGAKWIGNLA